MTETRPTNPPPEPLNLANEVFFRGWIFNFVIPHGGGVLCVAIALVSGPTLYGVVGAEGGGYISGDFLALDESNVWNDSIGVYERQLTRFTYKPLSLSGVSIVWFPCPSPFVPSIYIYKNHPLSTTQPNKSTLNDLTISTFPFQSNDMHLLTPLTLLLTLSTAHPLHKPVHKTKTKAGTTITESQILTIAPTSNTCDNAPAAGECATADTAAKNIAQSFDTYSVTSKAEQAAVISLMAFESLDFKYNKNHFPGVAGQGSTSITTPQPTALSNPPNTKASNYMDTSTMKVEKLK